MMENTKYKVKDRVVLIAHSEFGDQFAEWNSPYATITDLERGVHRREDITWCNIRTASGYTNAYPEQDLLPYFSSDLKVTNKQARVLLEDN